MAEEHVCGKTEIHGGKYEWVCMEPPGHTYAHAFKPFARVA